MIENLTKYDAHIMNIHKFIYTYTLRNSNYFFYKANSMNNRFIICKIRYIKVK